MTRDRVVALERVRAGDLVPNEANWRRHPDAQRDALTAVLADVGYADALIARRLADGRLELLDGHLRSSIDADAVVPVLVVDLDDREAATVLATLDPLAAMAVTDEAALRALLEGIGGADDPLRRLAEAASASALPPATRPKLDDEEEPQPRGEPTTQPGDVWRLGEHRLICGDAAAPDTLDRLFDGVGVDCLLTDPPYGIALETDYSSIQGLARSMLRQPGRRLVVANDYPAVTGDDRPFDAAPIAARFDATGEQFWFGANYYRRTLPGGDLDGSWLVWDKRPSGWNDDGAGIDDMVGSGFELIWSRRRHQQRVLRHQWSGFTARNTSTPRAHPTEKPIRLLADLLDRWTSPDAAVADPFAGSGTTLLACEQLGRRCYAVEIEPAYCDVVVDRWQALTGREATRA